MSSVLQANYTDNVYNLDQGGPQNIIAKIISSQKVIVKNDLGYLSYDYYIPNISNTSEDEKQRTLKAFTTILYNKFTLYKKIVESPLYQPIHHYKRINYFRRIKREKLEYSIIHAHDSVILSLLNINPNSKKIVTVHSKGPLSHEISRNINSRYYARIVREKLSEYEVLSLNQADIITFPSLSAANYFESNIDFRIDSNKKRIIYNGIDNHYINKISPSDVLKKYGIEHGNNLLILNVASDSIEKNINVVVRAIHELKRKNINQKVRLINVGIESRKEDVINLINSLSLDRDIILLGKIPNDDVIKLMKVCDIFLAASDFTIFDLSLLEALSCGCCVLVSKNGGNQEVIEESVNGYFIEEINPELIAEKIVTIDIESTKFNAMRTAQYYSIERMINNYISMYKEVQ